MTQGSSSRKDIGPGPLATPPGIREEQPPISRRRLAALAALAVPVTAANLPIAVYLPAIYSQSFGMPLATIGLVFLIERLWGTLADPLVGVLSDRTRSRFGRRKVWIAAGGLLFGLSTVLLFFPGRDVGLLHLTVTLFFFYLAWAMVQIPYLAWSGELTRGHHERTRIASFQMVAGAISMFVILLVPTIADRLWPDDPGMKLNAMGLAIAVPLLPALIVTLRAFPDFPPDSRQPWQRLNPAEAMRLVARERPLLKIILADLVITFGQGCRGALFIFFVTFCVGAPGWASGLFLVQFVVGIFAAPIWSAAARRFGKTRAGVSGELAQVAINLALLAIGKGDIVPMLFLTIAQGLSQSSGNLLLRSMLADAAEDYRIRTGIDRTALIFSGFSVSAKVGMALAIGIALPLVAWFGFDPAAGQNPPEALTAVTLVFALGPALAHLMAALIIRNIARASAGA